MDVYLSLQPDGLEVIVSDEGVGIRPNVPDPGREVQGLGLSLIQALTDRVEFHGGAAEGTEVRMAFTLDHTIEMPDAAARQREREVHPPPGEYSVAVAAGPMAGPVLSRVSAVLGARAGFSLEAISEAQLVTDAIAAHAARAIVGRHIHVGFEVGSGSIVVRVGPLDEGGARLMLDTSGGGGMPPVRARLPNEVAVEEHPDGELLRLTLAGGR
jgi:hypothetical protein